MAKGLCYASLELYKEAVHDFSIVIQLDEECGDAYFYRGRCAFILGDSNTAFLDYQKFIMANPDDPYVHTHAGDLLVLIQSYEDAIKAYTNANSTRETAMAHSKIAKCHLILGQLAEAIQDIDSSVNLEESESLQFDKKILEALSAVSPKNLRNPNSDLSKTLALPNDGEICKFSHVHTYKGLLFFYLQEVGKARTEFRAAMGSNELSESQYSELLYNETVCCILENDYDSSINNLSELVHLAGSKECGKIYMLLAMLQTAQGQPRTAKQFLKEVEKRDPELIGNYAAGETVNILMFSSESEFAKQFPMTELTLEGCSTVMVRLSCSLPVAQPPSLVFSCENSILKHFEVKSVKCRPEAPWLMRVKGSI